MQRRGWCVGVAALLCARPALSGTVNLDNGVGNVMYGLNVDVDDYGSFGREVSPLADDEFWPSGVSRKEGATFMSSSFLFVTAPIANGQVVLSTHQKIIDKVEAGGDGIEPDGALTRTVSSPIVKTANTAHSEFFVTNGGTVRVEFKLDQRITNAGPTSRLEQDYTIKNTGTASVTLVFHTFWDMDLYYGDQLFESDVVGAGTGLCYVYMHDPGNPSQGGSLADGGSTVPVRYYYAGKMGVAMDGGEPFYTSDNAYHPEWLQLGMPANWRNAVANVGHDVAGATTASGDGIIGMEWRFTLAINETQTIRAGRVYGTNAVPCNVSASCGNNTVDAGETCDQAADSTTCNAATCTAPTCNDGYVNAAAGEECESAGVDSIDCNGATCKHSVCGDSHVNTAAGEACDDGEDTAACNAANCQPPACGDGIVNFAANEDCEDGELCDVATCQYTYSVGGGCGGCASGAGATPWIVILIVLGHKGRTRRRELPREPRCTDR